MRDMRREGISRMRNGRADGPFAGKKQVLILNYLWGDLTGVQRWHVYETEIIPSGGVLIQLDDTIQYLRRHLCDTGFHLIHRF